MITNKFYWIRRICTHTFHIFTYYRWTGASLEASLKFIISERRGETRREASRRSTQGSSCYSHMGEQNNNITREILILALWYIEQNFFPFRLRTYIRDEPARPEPARPWRSLTLHISASTEAMDLKFQHNVGIPFKLSYENPAISFD